MAVLTKCAGCSHSSACCLAVLVYPDQGCVLLPAYAVCLCLRLSVTSYRYAMVACKAFGFCLTYKRNTEFRRLCDILRQHLANINK